MIMNSKNERQDQTEEEEVEPRRSKRARNEKSFGPDFVSFMVENEPTSYREAANRDYGLHYDRHPAVIEGYSDANWIFDIKDSRSTSGYVFTLGGAAIILGKSSKQTL
ncbi:hypothetical protein Tco_0143381 [Tanacetum coccineum]